MLTWTTRSVSWGQRQQGTWVREALTRSPALSHGAHSHPPGLLGLVRVAVGSVLPAVHGHSASAETSSTSWRPSGPQAFPLPAVEFSRKGPQLEPAVGLAENKAFFVRLWHTRQSPSPRPGRAGAMSPCPHWHEHSSERLSPLGKATQQAGQSRVVQSVFSTHQVPERRGCVQAPLPPSPSRA